MKVQILRCGSIQLPESAAYGNRINLLQTGRQILAPQRERVSFPVCAYLIEHPKGLLLVDTGWCRDISPKGIYDPNAAAKVLPKHLAAFYRPSLPAGMAVHEQLAARAIRPEDLNCVILTHLDPDHVAGLRHLHGAQRIVLPEDEYFWACRLVYKSRQPWDLWIDEPIERLYYRGSPLGPNHWAIDLFGDESVLLVNLPGHTDGQAAVLLQNGGQFVLLAADAAFSRRNWEEGVTPGFGFSEMWQRKSLDWIREKAMEPGCRAVLCSHDPDQPELVEF